MTGLEPTPADRDPLSMDEGQTADGKSGREAVDWVDDDAADAAPRATVAVAQGDGHDVDGDPKVDSVEALASGESGAAQPSGEDVRDVESAEAGPSDEVPVDDAPVDEGPTEDETRGPGPGANLDDDELRRRIAALLFASAEPVSVGRLVSLLERPPAARVRAALESLAHSLATAGLPIEVRGLRGGYTLMTVPELGQVVGRLAKGPTIERISGAALETLSIVAYRQPVTKAEVESIRGVQAGPILRTLVDRGLVKVVGRADVPGHPLQYGTGKEFLDRFGLLSLDELPRDAELARG